MVVVAPLALSNNWSPIGLYKVWDSRNAEKAGRSLQTCASLRSACSIAGQTGRGSTGNGESQREGRPRPRLLRLGSLFPPFLKPLAIHPLHGCKKRRRSEHIAKLDMPRTEGGNFRTQRQEISPGMHLQRLFRNMVRCKLYLLMQNRQCSILFKHETKGYSQQQIRKSTQQSIQSKSWPTVTPSFLSLAPTPIPVRSRWLSEGTRQTGSAPFSHDSPRYPCSITGQRGRDSVGKQERESSVFARLLAPPRQSTKNGQFLRPSSTDFLLALPDKSRSVLFSPLFFFLLLALAVYHACPNPPLRGISPKKSITEAPHPNCHNTKLMMLAIQIYFLNLNWMRHY